MGIIIPTIKNRLAARWIRGNLCPNLCGSMEVWPITAA